MNTKNTLITLGGLCLIGMVAFVFYPSQSKADSNRYKIEPNISIESCKSDAVRVSESYKGMMGKYINAMDNRLVAADEGFDIVSTKLDSIENRIGMTDRGLDKVTTKLDTIEKKIDDLAIRLSAIEKALNISQQIPKPK